MPANLRKERGIPVNPQHATAIWHVGRHVAADEEAARSEGQTIFQVLSHRGARWFAPAESEVPIHWPAPIIADCFGVSRTVCTALTTRAMF